MKYNIFLVFKDYIDYLWFSQTMRIRKRDRPVWIVDKTHTVIQNQYSHLEIHQLKVRWFRNTFSASSISSKKLTKTHSILVKMNSFLRFLEEFMAWQFAFEINWPLKVSRFQKQIVLFSFEPKKRTKLFFEFCPSPEIYIKSVNETYTFIFGQH